MKKNKEDEGYFNTSLNYNKTVPKIDTRKSSVNSFETRI